MLGDVIDECSFFSELFLLEGLAGLPLGDLDGSRLLLSGILGGITLEASSSDLGSELRVSDVVNSDRAPGDHCEKIARVSGPKMLYVPEYT